MKLYLLIPFCAVLSGCFLSGGQPVPEWVAHSCDAAPAFSNSNALTPLNADAMVFRKKFQSGAPVSIAIVGDSTTYGNGAGGMPNAVQLLDSYVKSINPASVVYNFGLGGSKASDHIALGTVATISMISPRPDATFIALGINDTLNRSSELSDLQTLIGQVRGYGMLPVLVHENNISCTTGWGAHRPSPFWQFVRYEVDQAESAASVDDIDLGSNDGYVDPLLMHDALHPNGAGYQVIAGKYEAWLNMP